MEAQNNQKNSVALPKGLNIKSIVQHGECNIWFVTGRIQAYDCDGNQAEFFVKVGQKKA